MRWYKHRFSSFSNEASTSSTFLHAVVSSIKTYFSLVPVLQSEAASLLDTLNQHKSCRSRLGLRYGWFFNSVDWSLEMAHLDFCGCDNSPLISATTYFPIVGKNFAMWYDPPVARTTSLGSVSMIGSWVVVKPSLRWFSFFGSNTSLCRRPYQYVLMSRGCFESVGHTASTNSWTSHSKEYGISVPLTSVGTDILSSGSTLVNDLTTVIFSVPFAIGGKISP